MARPSRSEAPTTYVILVRGINVGGSSTLAMADLRAACTDAGCAHVSTYIQSGNVLCTSPAAAAELAEEVGRQIESRGGPTVTVVTRTRSELAEVIAANPFPAVTDPTKLVVGFLRDDPPPGVLDSVDLAAFAPEEGVGIGRHLYLHLPEGQGRAKLPAALTERVLGGPVTVRNWRTVTKLLELADATTRAAEPAQRSAAPDSA